MSDELVAVEHSGGVATVTLRRPNSRNVLSAALVHAIGDTYDKLESDPRVRAVVLTGEGSAFCAGAELSTLEASASGDFDSVKEIYEGFLRVLHSPLVTIGAINGPAVGAGFNLALACDVRLAGESARFDTRFAALHLHPGGGHTWLLAKAVGQQQATLACLFGEVWDAQTARKHGLVAEVYPDNALLPAATSLARRLDDQNPDFTRLVTASIRGALTTPSHQQALESEARAQQWSAKQPEFLSGLRVIQDQIAARRRG
ncbi:MULTISPECIES: enoyl-CoA hydratase-related protein [unclassified Rhodococcus (in: high G+C Gram-positive bacteria)]|uniref:enoyl-CoA hydratase-related protein n=1 Tax=unclassified Rhodococcus (in: high G+C Gram-positive bacteria) TaxID=192944 RepID=UPI00178C1AA6|nr:enoyl-CoA hydratase-related protein [Rhodococcus sp. DK17]